MAPMLALEKGREGTSRPPVALGRAEIQGPPKAQSPREAAWGRGGCHAREAQRGQGSGREENKQKPLFQVARPRPGRVVPAENHRAIQSCCLQSPGLQGHGQAPRLCLHSNVTSHPRYQGNQT